MKLNEVLKELSFAPPKDKISQIKSKLSSFLPVLKKELKGDVFLGGSFAKETMVNKKVYDVDIFVRLAKNKFDTQVIERAAKKACAKFGYPITTVHGSRDYFRVGVSDNAAFEIVPALKISKPKEAENVIDLSYFHVGYARKKMFKNKNLAREIQIAKAFLMASNVYGAESYIRGFSGYAVECLIIYYKTFERFLRTVAESVGKIIIDPEKQYKKKEGILFMMNEGKTTGPLVLVDPTWKERNVTAAVSQEAFDTLKKAAISFLKHPNKSFFEEKMFDVDKFKQIAKKGEEYARISITTEKQDGDIAGTKLKKFASYLLVELNKELDIIKNYFAYDNKKTAQLYLIALPKKEIVFRGPPVKMDKYAAKFRKEHKNAFVKAGKLFAKKKVSDSALTLVKKCIEKNRQKAKDMAIVEIEIKNN